MPNPNFPQQVFAGTDWGLYYTDDITVDSPEWFYFESFPRVMVWELVVDRGYTTLAAFTRSRGAWAWPLPNAAIGNGADLAVTNSGSASVGAGAQATFVVTVKNNGPNTANNVVVSDPTPAGVTLASVSGDCAALPCTFATLANGVTRTITATYNVPSNFDTSQSIVNIASVHSDTEDNVSGNNSATATTAVTSSADLALAMTGPASTATNGNVSYTITVTNNGPSVAQPISVADPTPIGLSFVSNTGDCTTTFPCAFASLASGVSRTILVTYAVPDSYAGSSIVNAANVGSATTDPVPANDSASVTTTITRSADLALAMQAPAGAVRGGTVSYTIALSNVGPGTAQTVSVADPTPAGLVFVSNSGDCASAFPCAFGSLAPGATKIITATFQVPVGYAGASPFVNTATVSSSTTDPVPGNNSAGASVSVSDSADLSIAQSGTTAVLAGGNVSYMVTVANAGPSSASAVSVSDATPAGLTLGTVNGDCSALPCNLGTLAPGASRNYVVTFAVPANYAGANPITNSASVTSTTNDPNLNNNVYAAHTTVGAGADVAVTVTAPTIVPAGGSFEYTVSVTNNGPSVAQSVQLNSALPAGLVFVGNAGDCTSAFPCSFPTLVVGVTKTVTATVCVPQDYSSSIPMHLSANATSSTTDAYLGNNSDAANVLLYADVIMRDGFESSTCQ